VVQVKRPRSGEQPARENEEAPRRAEPVQTPIVEERPQEGTEQRLAVLPPDSTRPHSASLDLRPRLTYAAAESLGQLFPHLREHLLREAVIQRVLEEDSAYQAWHGPLAASLVPRDLPDEFEAAARTNQARFGVPYNPMRGPTAPNQVDIIALIRALRELTSKSKGK
jgi:hypothetical protein